MNCNKRRVASIAALLSSVLHPSVFDDESMHEVDNAPGPLKWVIFSLPRQPNLSAFLCLSSAGILQIFMVVLHILISVCCKSS